MSSQPTSLVTGAAGFIGSHLCERLLARGCEVICLDNYFSGKRANIAHLRSNPNFELIRHDTVEPILLESDLRQRAHHVVARAQRQRCRAQALGPGALGRML